MGSWSPLHWLFAFAIAYFICKYLKSFFLGGLGEPKVNSSKPHFVWPSEDYFDFDIVGESNYQNALRRIAGAPDDKGVNKEVTAVLHLEDQNKFDNKAVRVDIDGYTVGYLSREDARSYRRRLGAKKMGKVNAQCTAQVTGGFLTRDGMRASYGVRLAIKPFR